MQWFAPTNWILRYGTMTRELKYLTDKALLTFTYLPNSCILFCVGRLPISSLGQAWLEQGCTMMLLFFNILQFYVQAVSFRSLDSPMWLESLKMETRKFFVRLDSICVVWNFCIWSRRRLKVISILALLGWANYNHADCISFSSQYVLRHQIDLWALSWLVWSPSCRTLCRKSV